MLHQGSLPPRCDGLPRKPCCRYAPTVRHIRRASVRPRSRQTVICAASQQTFYDVLGVSQTATEREIKSAYRKKALKLHPDVNKAPDAEKQFMQAKMAFETLGDAQKRAEYDRKLKMGSGFSSDWSSWGSGFGASSSSSSYSSYKRPKSQPEDDYSLEDLLRDLDKEFSSWVSTKSGDKKPKSLLEELEMLGEELVDFLEDTLGTKESKDSSSKAGSGSGSQSSSTTGSSSSSSSSSSSDKKTSGTSDSSSSGSTGGYKNPVEAFDDLWRKYGDPFVGGATGASSSSSSTSSGSSSSSAGSGSTGSGSYTKSTSTSNSNGASGRTAGASKPADDDIDAMLAALKKKVGRDK